MFLASDSRTAAPHWSGVRLTWRVLPAGNTTQHIHVGGLEADSIIHVDLDVQGVVVVADDDVSNARILPLRDCRYNPQFIAINGAAIGAFLGKMGSHYSGPFQQKDRIPQQTSGPPLDFWGQIWDQ